jgi:hypothetical protein
MTPEQFKDSMAYLGIAYGKEFTQQEITIYYDFLKEYSDVTLVNAIKSIIKKSKFLPKITEILEECENCKEKTRYEILEFMQSKGYFKAPSEYDKAVHFLETDVVPEWFKKDMNEYYRMMKQAALDHKEMLMLGV